MKNATIYLSFRKQFENCNPTARMFAMNRVTDWLQYELINNSLHDDDNKHLLAHLKVNTLLINEAWWRKLRTFTRTSLFYKSCKMF